ncbi:MAG: hypothetical protein JXM79_08660, partial [Sedimentisphaerales bacterium]|nr:hypothetical protein [Sedimentisphaerales bacterium]
SKKVMVAMKQLRHQYRAVLSLRCFEQLSYSDIAMAMDCTEVGARVLFYRAKQALRKQLGHQGLKKGMLLAGIGFFGTLSAPVEAASTTILKRDLLLECLDVFGRLTAPIEPTSSTMTIPAAATQVGPTAAILGTVSSRLGIAIMTVIAVILAVISGLSHLSESPSPLPPPTFQRADVNSFHFTIQLHNPDPNADPSSLNSKGAYEHWFYLPEGVDGPMLMRMQRWTPLMEEKLCAWLQDAEANYYYDSETHVIHINNCRVCWSNLRVRRLPTDSQEFIDFLSFVEGEPRGFSEYFRDPNNGLLSSLVDYRFINAPEFETNYLYNTVGAEHFQYDWPATTPVIDERDKMHKRGWTYFSVNGKVNEKAITGRGCIPFFYKAVQDHPAWMVLNIGDDLEIIESRRGACIRRADGTTLTYPPGTFFKGLARPWRGLHAADVVRRDAAEQHIWFKSKRMDNKDYVLVTLLFEERDRDMDLLYAIDMENDVIRDIRFKVGAETQGFLEFSYLQDIDHAGNEFTEPATTTDPKAFSHPYLGILWLAHLVRGSLGQ